MTQHFAAVPPPDAGGNSRVAYSPSLKNEETPRRQARGLETLKALLNMTTLQFSSPARNNFRATPAPSHERDLRAELIGERSCIAAGMTVPARAPALVMCRELLAAGIDSDRALEVYRTACCRCVSSRSPQAPRST
jgi:hypothetical protein